MHARRFAIFVLIAAVTLLAGCNDDDGTVAFAGTTPTTGSASADGSEVPATSDDPEASFAGPALETDAATLDASLHCTAFAHPDKPPVLLVHGTTVTGTEQYTVFYTPQLVERGFDVCIVTYPDRGLGDMQVSAEYIVHALRTIHAETGRKVAMIGHSQGGTMPRWAIKFWPSAREALADFVMIAGPNHGTTVALPATVAANLQELIGLDWPRAGLLPEALYQFEQDSDFVRALNAGDETPGDIDYTALYTRYDELVQPVKPVPTAALDFDQDNPRVANILLQDVCQTHYSEHFAIGTSDPLAFALAVDAISNSGPADFERAGGAAELCGMLPLELEQIAMPANAARLLKIVETSLANPQNDPHLAADEPPLKAYAQDEIETAP